MILAEYHLKGLKGDGIFTRYKELLNNLKVPFTLIDRDLELGKRKEFLKEGITELYEPGLSEEIVVERIDFLKQMLEAKLGDARQMKYEEYKIPVAKRVFDIVVAGLALLVLSPLLILVIIALRLESRGPIFYVSKRVGTGYKVFDFYKFRSMYVDAAERLKEVQHLNQYSKPDNTDSLRKEYRSLLGSPTLIYKDGTPMSEEEYLELKRKQQAGTFIKIANDPRVTKVGKFIRNTSVDELPQLFNVLKGDMSIVGNRPLPLYEAEQLTSDDWGERFLAPAGITGLWQVEKRGKGEMSEEERKALDNKYAKNFSFWNDIRLILKTIPALFQKENV
ncbi:MAG TPA: sugar transferase [Cryomorphaceae bacterium]|nr:glycosyl transferase [Owenweeksia sp.]MBF99340.1 glycosyl transferase [Owenweeksia sp.]HAD96810.1 sugar transferase [Cryomorphaceae bacterium]HBF21751.1 sugar transferase [Cryomorphaceae bacterium]HCQ15958.1 sugar transferase [Cryomorphaceae bacterium]